MYEIKTLGEISTEIYNGDEVLHRQMGKGTYPGIKCGDINSKLPMIFKECRSFVNIEEIKNKKHFKKGDLLMSGMGDENVIGKVIMYDGDDEPLAGGSTRVIRHNQNPKYMVYALNAPKYRREILKAARRSSIVWQIYANDIRKIKIRIPDLRTQNVIVKFLDSIYPLIQNKLRKIQFHQLLDKLC